VSQDSACNESSSVGTSSDPLVGFVNQFGTIRDATGALALDAQYVGAWNGSNFGSQVLFQLLSPFTANLFGIRFNMYCFTSLIVLVSGSPSLIGWVSSAAHR
jgi:hypothetical protein